MQGDALGVGVASRLVRWGVECIGFGLESVGFEVTCCKVELESRFNDSDAHFPGLGLRVSVFRLRV